MQEFLAKAKEAGVELGPELSAEFSNELTHNESTPPAEAKPKSEVETKLESLTLDAPEEVEPEDKSKELEDLGWLDLPEDVGLEDTKEPLDLPETPEAKKFAEDFKQYMGFDITELREGIQVFKQMQEEIVKYRAQKTVDTQMKALKQEWGVDGAEFDGRMQKVVERFNKYPKELKDKLDGIEGAKLIWAKIEQEEAAKQRKPNVPTFERSRGKTQPGQKPMFTQVEIDNMDMATYERNIDKIYYAYANGLVAKG